LSHAVLSAGTGFWSREEADSGTPT